VKNNQRFPQLIFDNPNLFGGKSLMTMVPDACNVFARLTPGNSAYYNDEVMKMDKVIIKVCKALWVVCKVLCIYGMQGGHGDGLGRVHGDDLGGGHGDGKGREQDGGLGDDQGGELEQMKSEASHHTTGRAP
jgi:hypothetical protein